MELQKIINKFRNDNGGPFTPSREGFRVLDLKGKTFEVKHPIYIHKMNNVILSNFRINVSDEFIQNSNFNLQVPKFTEKFALNFHKYMCHYFLNFFFLS